MKAVYDLLKWLAIEYGRKVHPVRAITIKDGFYHCPEWWVSIDDLFSIFKLPRPRALKPRLQYGQFVRVKIEGKHQYFISASGLLAILPNKAIHGNQRAALVKLVQEIGELEKDIKTRSQSAAG